MTSSTASASHGSYRSDMGSVSSREASLRRRLLRWFPRWTGTRWGTWTKAAVYFLAGAAGLACVLYGIDDRITRLLALVYGSLALVASARHVAGATRWSDKPVPRRVQRNPADVGVALIRDYESTTFSSNRSSSGVSDTAP